MVNDRAGARSVRELFDLSGRVALVTGGANGKFGSQVAEALAEAGARVVASSRDAERARRWAAGCAQRGLAAEGEALDLTDGGSVRGLVDRVLARHGRIDILFNSASAVHLEPFETVALEEWERVLAINITGTMLMARAVAPSMLARGCGVIVNLSSIYGMVAPDRRIYGDSGLNSPLVYGATKAAVIQMTRFWAAHWAPSIRVNCITPGGLYAGQDRRFVEGYVGKTPLGRMAGPDDLKGAAVFLASDASAWVTGHNLVVDGGWTIW